MMTDLTRECLFALLANYGAHGLYIGANGDMYALVGTAHVLVSDPPELVLGATETEKAESAAADAIATAQGKLAQDTGEAPAPSLGAKIKGALGLGGSK